MTLDDRLSTLDRLWAVWAAHGRSMTDGQWRAPTRLGDWDVRSLYAHHGAWPFALSMLVDRVVGDEPTHVTRTASTPIIRTSCRGVAPVSRSVASSRDRSAVAITSVLAIAIPV